MSNLNSSYTYLTTLDLYYLSISSNISLYGNMLVMIIGFIGDICQIITFSRKTMRNISTGVLFLALSISDTIYLLLCIYILIIYGFNISDQSNYDKTCQFRHFINYLSTNFSAWMLTTISCDRWFRSQFPLKSQRICTPRMAIYSIILALIFDCLLHIHILTPMFGQIAPEITTTCGANELYPIYTYFYVKIWPSITILSVTIIPASCILGFILAITINVKNSQNRVVCIQYDRRRGNFLHRQMLILMLVTLILFFLTTFPVAIFRFIFSTLNIQQSFSFSLLLAAIFGFITLINYSLNFYLHCLTSKLFRKEFFKILPCTFHQMNIINTRQHLIHFQKQGTAIGQVSNTYKREKNCVTSV